MVNWHQGICRLLPFTRNEFIAVFTGYNTAIWPAQIITYLVGLGPVACLARPGRASDRLISGVLAVSWLWTGIVYHWFSLASINRAAYLFGAGFILEAALLVFCGVIWRGLSYRYSAGPAAYFGLSLVVFAAVIYPLVGLAAVDRYPRVPTFGLTPCPVTLFTFGMFLIASSVPKALLIVPLAWSLIGGTAAILLNVPQDWALLIGGPVASVVLWMKADRASQLVIRSAWPKPFE